MLDLILGPAGMLSEDTAALEVIARRQVPRLFYAHLCVSNVYAGSTVAPIRLARRMAAVLFYSGLINHQCVLLIKEAGGGSFGGLFIVSQGCQQ